jgi:hypothetical protein
MATPGEPGGEQDQVDTTDDPVGEVPEGTDAAGGDDADEAPAEQPDDEAPDGEQPDDEEVSAKPRKASRGEARFQRLANETRAAREEAAQARRDADELRRAQWQRDQHVSAQQEAERLALMTPEERADYKIAKFERDATAREQRSRFETQNLIDKTSFEAKATVNPVYARYQDEVETRFQELMRQGKPTEREVILKFMLGERALSSANGAGSAKKAAQQRVERQKVNAGSPKGDMVAKRGKGASTPEQRLKDVFI